jgi:hypothetical protein
MCSRLFFTEFSALCEIDQYGYKGTPYAVLPAVRLNKYGFNDTDDYVKEKRPHTVRILCLGNSSTFGFADQRYNWPYFLEELFKSHQFNVEVINTAFPGNSYTSLVRRFGDEYLSFAPDIVLIYCGFIHYSVVPYREYNLKRKKIKKIINSSHLIKKLIHKETFSLSPSARLFLIRKLLGIDQTFSSVTPKQLKRYEQDVELFLSLCRAHNIIPILSSLPTLVNEDTYRGFSQLIDELLYYYPDIEPGVAIRGPALFNRITKEKADEFQVPFVELSTGMKPTREYFIDYQHLTEKGERQVAYNYFTTLAPLIVSRSYNFSTQDKELNTARKDRPME